MIPSAAFTSFDADTLCLCLYIIVCVSSQVFLIIIRPLKEDLRNNIKTFWVVAHVMHLQVICLLGAAGGNLKGPVDRILGSCLKAMLKYLVFDVDFDFDGRLDQY